MVLFLHGYLLDGSGSNLWTRHILDHLCRSGMEVHFSCQEPHPELYSFIRRADRILEDGTRKSLLKRETGYAWMHKPDLGDTLPVYVRDQYEEFQNVIPLTEMKDAGLNHYVQTNFKALDRVCQEFPPRYILSNHTVLISEVARRLAQKYQIPFGVVPHGSALEYAVKKDPRLHKIAEGIFSECDRVFLVSPEIAQRLAVYFPNIELSHKTTTLAVGVDTGQFQLSAPANRPNQLAKLREMLTHAPAGRPTATATALARRVETEDLWADTQWQETPYPTKYPDEGLEQRLENWDEKSPTVIFVGRLIAAKGIHCLVESWAEVLHHVPNAQLIVVGHGPLREMVEAMALVRTRADRGRLWEGGKQTEPKYFPTVEGGRDFPASGSRIHFTGFLEHKPLSCLLPCADVAVVPSLVPEAGPMVLLEAAACGCFPLGTYQAGMAGNLDAVGAGLDQRTQRDMRLSPDPATLTQELGTKIVKALAHSSKTKETIRQATRDRFDWSKLAVTLASVLNQK